MPCGPILLGKLVIGKIIGELFLVLGQRRTFFVRLGIRGQVNDDNGLLGDKGLLAEAGLNWLVG